jgi:hypothetical protein
MQNIQTQLAKLSQRLEEKVQQREQRRNSMIKVARRASAKFSNVNLSEMITSAATGPVPVNASPPPPLSSSKTRGEALHDVRDSLKVATERIETFHRSISNTATAAPEINGGMPQSPQADLILKYLLNEFQFQKNLMDFYQVAIEPLINTTKGAELQIGLTDSERDNELTSPVLSSRKGGENTLFERRGSYLGVLDSFTGKKVTQQITEQISNSNFQKFLLTIENITLSLMEFLLLLEVSFLNRDESKIHTALSEVTSDADSTSNEPVIMIGTPCLTPQALTLYQLLLTYASSYHHALRIFSSNLLQKFKEQIEEKLPFLNSNLNSFLVAILHFPQRLKVLLMKLHETASLHHPDHTSLDRSLQHITDIIQQMHDVYTTHINYEKLISIQNSFLFTLFQPETYLQTLVSYQRTFVREGDLVKVCRKTNKEYRFWLFSDAVIYGKHYAPTGKYKLHRVIELTAICNIQPYTAITTNSPGVGGHISVAAGSGGGASLKRYAFIINSLEKSFILIASTLDERNSWINDINLWWKKLMKKRISQNQLRESASPVSPSENANTSAALSDDSEAAPLWVPDSVTSSCSICNIVSPASFPSLSPSLLLPSDRSFLGDEWRDN